MKLNAEAIRPGTFLERNGVLWKAVSNDTLTRVLVLEEVGTKNQTHQSYEPGALFNCTSIPHRREERDQGDADVIFIILVVCLLVAFIVIAIAAVSILIEDDSGNRQSCLERNGAILEDESGTMTGCIINRENP